MKKSDISFFSLAILFFIGCITDWHLFMKILVIMNSAVVLGDVLHTAWRWFDGRE